MTVLITFVESALSHRIVRFIVALYVFLMSCKNPIKPLAVICLFLSRSILVNILLSVNPPANMEAHVSPMQLCCRIRLLSFECRFFNSLASEEHLFIPRTIAISESIFNPEFLFNTSINVSKFSLTSLFPNQLPLSERFSMLCVRLFSAEDSIFTPDDLRHPFQYSIY